jgi:hypothetical protein
MRLISQFFVMSCAVAMVACGSTSGQGDVWSNYDYLTPIPEDSGVVVQPSDRLMPTYRQTQDNDDTYVIPYEYGICSDGRMGC